jgi:protein-S-isoprenylcysteine O-methyltransferase Ste14
VLSVLFGLGVTIVAAMTLSTWHGAALATGALVVLSYLAWILVEGRVAAREASKEKTLVDRGTMELYAFGRAATVGFGLAFAREPDAGVAVAGLVVFVAAVALRLAAIRQLGRFYSHRVRVAEDHRVVDTGPYGVLRHPAYTGMLLAHAGFVAVFFSPVAALVLALVLLPSVVVRIRVEERVLMTLEGYAEYAGTRRRLLPLVW